MANHVYHPPVELPDHVISYAQGLKDHKADYGEVAMNSEADLADGVAKANALLPRAKEIQDLELKLAALKEAYNKDAVPLWRLFSERLGYAKTFATKNGKNALLNFLRAFQHHQTHSAAAAAAKEDPKK